MKSTLRKFSTGLSRSIGSWLMLLLLLVVLVPSICLLWFMNEAVRNERLAIRQKLVVAYRGHLSLAQQRLEAEWSRRAAELDAQAANLGAPVFFASQFNSGASDSVICFDAAGAVVYPGKAVAPEPEPTGPAWSEAEALEQVDFLKAAGRYERLAEQTTNNFLAARALQAQARCLLQAGQRAAALTVLTNRLAQARFRDAADSQGRLIAPNARLMALEMLNPADTNERAVLKDELQSQLLDYTLAMPSAQRRFLMRELQRLFPGSVRFPILAAEDLAARTLESGIQRNDPILRPGIAAGTWQFGSKEGRVITLLATGNLAKQLERTLQSPELPVDIHVDVVPPGGDAERALISIPAGSTFPGWRLAMNLKDQDFFEAATRQKTSTYVWIGVLVIALVGVLALLAIGLVRRQVALTQLRNDLVANVTHELKTPLSSMRLLVETLLSAPQIHEQTAREYLELIARENLRLSRLIENFLTFSRIERNKYQFNFKTVPAAAIANAAAGAVRERFNVSGCEFAVKIAPNLPLVRADADAMVTALLNLLDNAFKYSGESKQITFTAAAANGSVSFSIEDNGIGLSRQDARRVFKRFYQVRQQTVSTGGSGLGLSIAHLIVTAHRGTIDVESEPGRGSRFIISLKSSEKLEMQS
jgi:signal transduction histidine kinase